MIGEHRWLETTAISLDEELKARKVTNNMYALVGFASEKPTVDSRLGRIIPVGPNGEHCGTATQMKAALKSLHTDGRLEDGYSAMGVALQDVSCMKARLRQQASATACQIILITDEDRDTLTAWTFETMRDELARQDCSLNVIIQERFMGKGGRLEYPAFGVYRQGRAVVATSDYWNFELQPNGAPIPDTGYGDIWLFLCSSFLQSLPLSITLSFFSFFLYHFLPMCISVLMQSLFFCSLSWIISRCLGKFESSTSSFFIF